MTPDETLGKEKCIDEAVEALPEVLEFYQKVYELGIEVEDE